MFDTAAAQVLAAVERSEGGQNSDASITVEWASIRRHCKGVMVCLESNGQHILAARVEREYERLKQARNAPDLAESKRARHVFADAAEELHTTLVALSRFQKHLSREVVTGRGAGDCEHEAAPTTETPSSECRIDRGVVTDQRLRELFRANLAKYRREGRRILDGDMPSKRQFSAEFGSMALARQWAEEEGRGNDLDEVNRWGTAIRSARFYRVVFKPLTGQQTHEPAIWPVISKCDTEFDDIIHEVMLMLEDAP